MMIVIRKLIFFLIPFILSSCSRHESRPSLEFHLESAKQTFSIGNPIPISLRCNNFSRDLVLLFSKEILVISGNRYQLKLLITDPEGRESTVFIGNPSYTPGLNTRKDSIFEYTDLPLLIDFTIPYKDKNSRLASLWVNSDENQLSSSVGKFVFRNEGKYKIKLEYHNEIEFAQFPEQLEPSEEIGRFITGTFYSNEITVDISR